MLYTGMAAGSKTVVVSYEEVGLVMEIVSQ